MGVSRWTQVCTTRQYEIQRMDPSMRNTSVGEAVDGHIGVRNTSEGVSVDGQKCAQQVSMRDSGWTQVFATRQYVRRWIDPGVSNASV